MRDPERDYGDAARFLIAGVFNTLFSLFIYQASYYCRPSCPARRPKRTHVRFHESTAEAERAGFRPCKREAKQAHIKLIGGTDLE